MIAITGDFHLGDKRHSKFENGIFTKIEDEKLLMQRLINNLQMKNIQNLIILGDIFDSKILNEEYVSFLIEWLNKLEKLEINTFIIPGNHESTADKYCLDFLKKIKYEYVHYINNYEVWDIENNKFIFIPFMNAKFRKNCETLQEEYNELIESYSNDFKQNFNLCGHFQDVNYKLVSSNINLPDEINLQHKHIDFVFSGHIHHHKTYKMKNTTICYPGSLYSLDFADNKDQKGYIVFDGKNAEFIPLIDKEFHVFEIQNNIIPDEINSLTAGYLKLKFSCDKKQIDEEKIKKTFPHFDKIIFEYINQNQDSIKTILDKNLTPIEICKEVIKNKNYEAKDKETILDTIATNYA